MKKSFILLALSLFLLVGCSMGNTPSSNVEALFMKYQKLDNDISSEIDAAINEQNFTEEQRDRYRKLIEAQYKNLSYEIKDERIDGSTATVTAEVEVIDYKRAINDLTFDSTIYTKESFDNEKLNRLESMQDKVTYTIDFYLTKDNDGVWNLNALSTEEIKKIQGMF